MDRETEKIVLLFANISDSTHLYDRMDDITATHMIKECLSLMQEVTQQQMGDVVNTIGDKVNCIFWDATSAVLAAKGMNEAIDSYLMQDTDDRIPINLHIGIHSGPVQKEGNKIFGDTVNLVARVTKKAKPREILITQEVFDDLETALKTSAQLSTAITVKGNSSPFNLYEYIWEEIVTTVAIDRDQFRQLKNSRSTRLELTAQKKTYEVTRHASHLTLGRQSQNDLVVRGKSASRFHASIEMKNDKFVLKDHSTNGTFIYPHEGDSHCVKQTEAFLEGSGLFCLGEDNVDSPLAISYRVEDAF